MTSQSFTTTNYTNTESGSIKGTGHNTFTLAEFRKYFHILVPKPKVMTCCARWTNDDGQVRTCCHKVVHCRFCTYCQDKINLDDKSCPNHPEDGTVDDFIDNEQFCELCFDLYIEWKQAVDFHQEWEFDGYDVDGFDRCEATYGPTYVSMFKRRIPLDNEWNRCGSQGKYYGHDGEERVKQDAYMFTPCLKPQLSLEEAVVPTPEVDAVCDKADKFTSEFDYDYDGDNWCPYCRCNGCKCRDDYDYY